MSAEEKQLKNISRLGIIAGGGDLPRMLIDACEKRGVESYVIGFEGQTDADTALDLRTHLGSAGKMIKAFKGQDIKDIVLIGSIKRPSLKDLKPDVKTLEFFAKTGLGGLGDDGLLKSLKKFLEKEGFCLHGIHDFMPELLAPEGAIGRAKPKKENWSDVEHGVGVLETLGALDIGQAVVVQNGMVLGVEAAEGTDELIKRCGALKRKGGGPVLVKLSKPGQEQDIDLPTIGERTIENAAQAGFAGVVIHAGHSLLINALRVAEIANKHKMFVIGLHPEAMDQTKL